MRISSRVAADYSNYLNDESGLITDGHADEIYFPSCEKDLIGIVMKANQANIPITISGGGTGISGGRVPLSGWIIATDNMVSLTSQPQIVRWNDTTSGKDFEYYIAQHEDFAYLTVPVSMTVKAIQNLCRELDWFYPPDPTERSCYIGGNVVTNASGARSFKFGPTRNWIYRLRVILPNGDRIILSRDDEILGSTTKIKLHGEKGTYTIPRPSNPSCRATKNVAGLVLLDDSQPIDLFIGNDGVLGIISEVTLKVVRPPKFILNIFIYVDSLDQAIALAQLAQKNRELKTDPIPMSIEYLDDRAVKIIGNKETIPESAIGLVILEQDARTETQFYEYIEFWMTEFEKLNLENTSVAQTHNEIEHHKYLRHLIPETINSIARKNGQPKLGTDYSAPLDHMVEMFTLAVELGEEFELTVYPKGRSDLQFAYALWSHFGDNHIHLNFLPTNDKENLLAKELMILYMKQVVAWQGSIAAEHGLGKKEFEGRPALQLQLGEEGLHQIYNIKKILDPNMLLNRENLLGRDLSKYE